MSNIGGIFQNFQNKRITTKLSILLLDPFVNHPVARGSTDIAASRVTFSVTTGQLHRTGYKVLSTRYRVKFAIGKRCPPIADPSPRGHRPGHRAAMTRVPFYFFARSHAGRQQVLDTTPTARDTDCRTGGG